MAGSPRGPTDELLAAAILSESRRAGIERLWSHLKRTVLANILFATLNDLVQAFRYGVACVNFHRNRMGFVFDHDDVQKKTA